MYSHPNLFLHDAWEQSSLRVIRGQMYPKGSKYFLWGGNVGFPVTVTYCSNFNCSPEKTAAGFRPGARRAIGLPSRRSRVVTKSSPHVLLLLFNKVTQSPPERDTWPKRLPGQLIAANIRVVNAVVRKADYTAMWRERRLSALIQSCTSQASHSVIPRREKGDTLESLPLLSHRCLA